MLSSQTKSRFGRITEAQRIQRVLNEWLAAPVKTNSFGILGISGYGGVGKSYLLHGVLNEQALESRDALVVKLDGSNKPLLSDFVAMVDEKLAPRTVVFKGSRPDDDQFPETRKLVTYQRKLSAKVSAEVEKSKLPDEIKKAAKALYRFKPLLSKIPTAGPVLSGLLEASQDLKVEEYAEPAAELLKGLRALNPAGRFPFRRLRITPLDRLAIKPLETISESYETDVRARLVGYEGRNFLKLLHRKAKGVNRLLLVIDDYESTGGVLGDLLVDHLFQRFAAAPYPVLAIIVGRDDLRDADPEYSKSLAPFERDRIQLEPFTKEEGILFLESAGFEAKEALELYEESNGYPFVLSMLRDFKSNQGDRPATFYQQFYDRTTQWMTTQQKEWLLPLCYLEAVNQTSIAKMIPNAPAAVVMDWFRREASVRDVKSPSFRVDPYIRKMLLHHHANLMGHEAQKTMADQGRAASSGAAA